MADNTRIEWVRDGDGRPGATLNYANGCSVVSPGCTNCYAMAAGARNLPGHPSTGLTRPIKGGPAVAAAEGRGRAKPKHVWTGEVRLSDKALHQALAWKRGRRIFWNAHGDLFHEAVPVAAIDRLFAVCALTPQHQHLILTKRSARMREYCTELAEGGRFVDDEIWRIVAPLPGGGYDTQRCTNEHARRVVKGMTGSPGNPTWWLPNVWLGVSVEDQARADERIPDLLATPAAVRFLSCEPLLGPVDLTRMERGSGEAWLLIDALQGITQHGEGRGLDTPTIDWVIAGGESGPGARPMHPDWARSLRDQCAAAGTAFFFKQWGLFLPTGQTNGLGQVWTGTLNGEPTFMRGTKAITGRLLDGAEHSAFPAGAA